MANNMYKAGLKKTKGGYLTQVYAPNGKLYIPTEGVKNARDAENAWDTFTNAVMAGNVAWAGIFPQEKKGAKNSGPSPKKKAAKKAVTKKKK